MIKQKKTNIKIKINQYTQKSKQNINLQETCYEIGFFVMAVLGHHTYGTITLVLDHRGTHKSQ